MEVAFDIVAKVLVKSGGPETTKFAKLALNIPKTPTSKKKTFDTFSELITSLSSRLITIANDEKELKEKKAKSLEISKKLSGDEDALRSATENYATQARSYDNVQQKFKDWVNNIESDVIPTYIARWLLDNVDNLPTTVELTNNQYFITSGGSKHLVVNEYNKIIEKLYPSNTLAPSITLSPFPVEIYEIGGLPVQTEFAIEADFGVKSTDQVPSLIRSIFLNIKGISKYYNTSSTKNGMFEVNLTYAPPSVKNYDFNKHVLGIITEHQ